jgi:ELP3 family radical SAM enzyme/protein acetyltransferase
MANEIQNEIKFETNETSKTKNNDIEELSGIDHFNPNEIYKTINQEVAEKFVISLIDMINDELIKRKEDWNKQIRLLNRKYHIMMNTVQLNYTFHNLLVQKKINYSPLFKQFNISHQVRSDSGIISVSIMTSPYPDGQEFSCAFDCHYCPNPKNGVRSYIPEGPAASRAIRNEYDCYRQMIDRLKSLDMNGHPLDKLEVIVLGGTWDSYPPKYRREFCRDIYYSANVYYTGERERLTLDEEKAINETSIIRIIGLTLETRPDQITASQINSLIEYGCTRVQIGVQHTNDRILLKVNRRCYLSDTIRAIYNLKNCGFKVDIHLMPQLPDATQEDDANMFNDILYNPDLQADQIKIYPCETTPWTKIEKWFLDGTYQPYPNEDMINLVIDFKTKIHPWIRLNRVGRDALPTYAIAGNPYPNLRQIIHNKMTKEGKKCNCIRCREVGTNPKKNERVNEAVLCIRNYESSEGREYFISYETQDREIIFGFCRLRLSTMSGFITEKNPETDEYSDFNLLPHLNNTAIIRELHVYGRTNRVNNQNKSDIQHRGFGKKMVRVAEELALSHGFKKMAIISGVGAREYYRKFGYNLKMNYMTKSLVMNDLGLNLLIIILLISILIKLFNLAINQ